MEDVNNLLEKLTKIYKRYPSRKIIKYLKHFPFYFLLFLHIYFFDKLVKKFNYKIWKVLKDFFTFKFKRKLFFDEQFWLTIPPYVDLFCYGAYIHTVGEYKLTKFIIKNFFNKKIIFFDIGANFGYYSVLVSKISPLSEIYAFEPNPYALEILTLNKRDNIKIIPKAIGGYSGKINFEKGHYMNSLATNVSLEQFPNKEEIIEVDIISLDEFSQKINTIPHFIKIDVERIELDVLKGATKILKQNEPIISLEFYFDEKFDYYKKCLDFLKDLQYEVYFIDFEGDLILVDTLEDLLEIPKKFNLIFDNLIFIKNKKN